MDTLPEEMLVEVLLKLRVSDVQCARLISKKFYEASLSPFIIDREKFVLKEAEPEDFDYCIDRLCESDRIYYHVYFTRTTITAKSFEKLIKKQAADIRSFVLDRCCMIDNLHFWRHLSKCSNLKMLTLKIRDPRNLLIDLDTIAHEFQSNAWQHLEFLFLDDCKLSNELSNTFARMAPNVRNFYTSDMDHLSFNDILSRMSARFLHIRSIYLSYDFCDDDYLIRIADVKFLNLTEIWLDDCDDVTDKGMVRLIDKQRRLRVIDIINGLYITDATLSAMAENLKDLDTFHIEQFNYITLNGLQNVLRRTPVRRLYAIGSHLHYPSTDNNIIAAITTTTTTTTAANEIVNNNLKELNLQEMELDYEHMKYITSSFPQLTHLILLGCNNITDMDLLLICRYLRNLKVLDMSTCSKLTDNGFGTSDDQSSTSFISRLENLESLYLESCCYISDITIVRYLTLPLLRCLNLSGCPELTARSVVALTENCPSLEILDISETLIDYDLFVSLVTSMQRLRKLLVYVHINEVRTMELLRSRNTLEFLYTNTAILTIDFRFVSFIRSPAKKKFVQSRYDILVEYESILEQIISNLGHTDLRCVRLVNKQFYRITLSRPIVDREIFVYRCTKFGKEFDYILNELLKIRRIFHHFRFSSTEIKMEQFKQLIQNVGEFIQSLEFVHCTINDHVGFWRCMRQCVNLKSLIIIRCDTRSCLPSFFSDNVALESWTSLNYFYAELFSLNDQLPLHKFMKRMPNIKNVLIGDLNLLPYGFDRLLQHIVYKSTRLEKITISNNFFRDEFLIKLAEINFSNLREIHLQRTCEGITTDGLKYFVEKQRQLEVLKVELFDNPIDNETLFVIANCLKNLKMLSIHHYSDIFVGLMSVMSRTSVRRVNFCSSFPYFFRTAGVIGVTGISPDATISNRSLTELALLNTSTLSQKQLEYIVRNFSTLVDLNLAYSNGVTNDVLRLICKYSKNLKYLDLKGCRLINDDGFYNENYPSFCESLSNLEKLHLTECQISDSTVQNYLKLPNLRLLSLNDCQKLTNNSFVVLPLNCPCLETLLMDTIHVDNETLLKTVRLLPRLRTLHIPVRDDIPDSFLEALYKCSNCLMDVGYPSGYYRSWTKMRFIR